MMSNRSIWKNLMLSVPLITLARFPLNLALAISAYFVLDRLVPRLRRFDSESVKRLSIEQLCDFVELYALGSAAGLTSMECLNLVREDSDATLAKLANDIIARCNLGVSLSESLNFECKAHPEFVEIARLIVRADLYGSPILESLQIELALMRSRLAGAALQKVKSLPIHCVFPLGSCFLPAFFLLTVVPIVFNLASQLLPAIS
ncbi:MAG: hypothetical protein EBS36_02700 [Actinobacteria bacterium]|nr:hypothetical protein [Actinomycetota bacterium]NBY14896.1 hypothetical protein [Actinomycetota bacterium]